MRPEKAARILKSELSKWYSSSNTKAFNGLHVLEALEKLIEKDKSYWKAYNLKEPDWAVDYVFDRPSPEEYIEWRGEMHHISDRWNSTRRLAWLYFGIIDNRFV